MATRNGKVRPAAAGLRFMGRDDQDRSLAMNADAETAGVIVPITDGQPILRREKREIGILVAREEVTITHARYAAGEQVAGPHVHHEHTDAFYIVEGELTFEIGREAEPMTISSGGFVAVPPEVAHSFRMPATARHAGLTIHAHDGASPRSCAVYATASTSSGISPRCPPRAASRQVKRSQAPKLAASAWSPGIGCAG